jgi:hypothetical protein
MAEAQKAGISGRSLSTYYEETTGKGGATHWSQGTQAIHALLDKQAADIAAIEARIRASEGVSASLAATSAASAAFKGQREAQISAAEQAVRGSELLKQKGAIDDVIASLKAHQAALELASPKIVTLGEDAYATAGYVAKLGDEAIGGALLLKSFMTAFPGVLAALKSIAAAAPAAAPIVIPAAAVAAAALAGPSPAETAFRTRVAAMFPSTPAPTILKPAPAPARAPTTINVTHSPTVNVTVAGDATPEKTATAVKAALDSHDRELEIKLKAAVDRAGVAAERSAFP